MTPFPTLSAIFELSWGPFQISRGVEGGEQVSPHIARLIFLQNLFWAPDNPWLHFRRDRFFGWHCREWVSAPVKLFLRKISFYDRDVAEAELGNPQPMFLFWFTFCVKKIRLWVNNLIQVFAAELIIQRRQWNNNERGVSRVTLLLTNNRGIYSAKKL